MIRAARGMSMACAGTAFVLVSVFGSGAGTLSLAAGLLMLAAGARVFGSGADGFPGWIRPWLGASAGLGLGAALSSRAGWDLALLPLVPLAGYLAALPERRTPGRVLFLALACGFGGFFASVSRHSPRDAQLAAFWAAAAFQRFPKLALGLWGAALLVGLRSGAAALPDGQEPWTLALSLAAWPALACGMAPVLQSLRRRPGSRIFQTLLWLLPAGLMGGWPPEALFPLAASAMTVIEGPPGRRFPERPLWVLPSSWDPELTTPRFSLNAGRVLGAALALVLGTMGFRAGLAHRGGSWAQPLESRNEAELEAALRFRPWDPGLALRLAELAVQSDTPRKAENHLERARTYWPRPAAWWRIRGLLYFRGGDFSGGLLHGARGVAEDPGNWKGYEFLGRLLAGVDPARAASILSRGILACPGNAELLKALASVYEGIGKARAALPLYQAAAGLQPRDVEALRGVCRTSYFRSRDPETRAYLNRLRRLVPNDPEVHKYLQRLDEP